MAYQSQLVVRSSSPDGTEVIDQVKELAKSEGKTYSEMAIELLARGLRGGGEEPAGATAPASTTEPAAETAVGGTAPASAAKPKPKAKAKKPEPKKSEKKKPEPKKAEAKKPEPKKSEKKKPEPKKAEAKKPEPKKKPDLKLVKKPAVEEKSAPPGEPAEAGSPVAVAQECKAAYDKKGAQAAAKALSDFFTLAGPIEGGELKDELQGLLNDEQYDEVFSALRNTDAYKAYKQRILYGR